MTEYDKQELKFWATIGGVLVGIIFAFCLLIGGIMWAVPKYKLYAADIEKRTLISEAKAKAEAAEHTAKAEVTKANYEADRDRIRAQGVADSNKLIDSSLSDQYIKWHYIDQMTRHGNQLIYVPTEGGIPILESSRLQPSEP